MLIVDMPMPKDCLWVEDGEIHKCPLLDDNGCCRGQSNEANEASESWSDLRKGCLIKGEGDFIDRHKTAEELSEMAAEVYYDFPLVDRETRVEWERGINMAAQYVQNLAGRKDAVIAVERKDDEY